MSEYTRTVTTNTSQEDTLTSAKTIAASLEGDGLFVTIGDPYTDHTSHSDPQEQRHRVDLTVSTKAPAIVVPAPTPEPKAKLEATPDSDLAEVDEPTTTVTTP